MARDLVTCPGCGRRVALEAPRRLAAHRIPLTELADRAPGQATFDGDLVVLAWPRCALAGVELDHDPPAARR